jgi:hypothetical protein
MTQKIVTNTTGSTILLPEVGKDLASSETYNIAAVQYPHWAYAARSGSFLETKILAGDITVSDGLTPTLNAALGLALLRDTLPRNIAFDNRFNSFIADDVQEAIEEAKVSGSSNEVLLLFACDAGAAVNDVVRMSTTVDSKVDTLTSNTYSNLAIGVIASKPSTTTCYTRILGLHTGLAGLTRAKPVFVSPSGIPTTTVPVSGSLQIIGVAVSSTAMIINVAMYKVIR